MNENESIEMKINLNSKDKELLERLDKLMGETKEFQYKIRLTPHIFSFSSENSIDIILELEKQEESKRYLVFFKMSKEIINDYQKLELSGVPTFPLFTLPSNEETENKELAIVEIPVNVIPLKSINFFETQAEPSPKIGAIEICENIGETLAQIYNTTKKLPQKLTLTDIALNPFPLPKTSSVIILPLALNPNSDFTSILNNLKREIEEQNPYINHSSQINALQETFIKQTKI